MELQLSGEPRDVDGSQISPPAANSGETNRLFALPPQTYHDEMCGAEKEKQSPSAQKEVICGFARPALFSTISIGPREAELLLHVEWAGVSERMLPVLSHEFTSAPIAVHAHGQPSRGSVGNSLSCPRSVVRCGCLFSKYCPRPTLGRP